MPSGGTIGNKGGTGRPVTVGATADVHVSLPPELLAKVRATVEAQHVTLSQALRLMMQLIVASPGDMLGAMVADPEAARTVFVERLESAFAPVPAVRPGQV